MAVLGATQYLQASIDRWHRERDKRLIYRRKSFCFSIRYVSAYRWCGWCSRTGNRNVFDSRGVYYNAASDMTNPRGAGTTYFHELAHMIDHASCNYRSNLSNTPEFAEALVEDGQRILSLYNNLPVEKQTAFLTRIRQDSAHSFSDLIDATTNGQLHGNYGHSRNYWTRPGNLQAEAFAHFFEASMGDQGKLELLANFFPTAFGIFSSMIDSIRPDNHVRVLSRER